MDKARNLMLAALTASNLLPSIHEINIIGMNAGAPPITRYAW